MGGKLTSETTKESIASLLTLDEVVSPLRVHSVNTLLSRFLGVLELSDVNSIDQFSDDKINFSKQFWANLLKIYGPNNRKFLERYTALFLLLRLTLQNLAQTRLLRVSSTTTFSYIQNKLDIISFSVDSPAPKN